jgi:hypothetical protein
MMYAYGCPAIEEPYGNAICRRSGKKCPAIWKLLLCPFGESKPEEPEVPSSQR